MLLLACLAAAEDLTVALNYDDQSWETTFARVSAGRLPSLVLDDHGQELRVDLALQRFGPAEIVLDFAVTRGVGTKAETLWKGTVSGTGTSMPTFIADGGAHAIQLIAVGSHAPSEVAAGPMAGCQFMRQAGMTDVSCRDVNIRHHRVDTVARDEIEAATARARANPALSVEAGDVSLDVGGKAVPGYRVKVSGPGAPPQVNVIAWTGVDGKDEVRCATSVESACLPYIAAFAQGLPGALQ